MEINKRNYQKVLRELDLAKYPSLDDFLRGIKEKLLRKEKLTIAEELMTFPKLKKFFEEYRKEINRYYINSIDFSAFKTRPPLSFQETGIKFLLYNDRCILADDMGLGKTTQAIVGALCLPEDYKILIVTLKSLKYNFESEIQFYSDSYKVIEKKWETGYKFTIVHYESLKKWKADILKEKFHCIISDESHFLKNAKVGRSKNFAEIIKTTEKVWLLTGTPITNRPIDFYNLLKIIKHPLSKNWIEYVEKYCDGKKEYGVWNVNGASNLQELYEKTKGSILRRLKTDHVKDLPNKFRAPVFLHLDSHKEYDKVIANYKTAKLEELLEEDYNVYDEDDIHVAEMTKFILWRQYCAMKKIEDGSLVELIDTQVSEGKKVVVFTNFTKVVDEVVAKFGKDARFIDGRIVDAKERLNIVNEYNEDPSIKVLVCNLRVGSVGLNIQSASVAIINDMDWVPSTMLQAEDRLWRIGQKNEVNILYPIYKGTVEEIVFKVINEKMRNISAAIEGREEEYFETNEKVEKKDKNSILQEIFAQLDF